MSPLLPIGLLTRRELAAKLSVHPQTISSKWEPEGLPVAKYGGKGRPSYYDETDVRAWLEKREAAAEETARKAADEASKEQPLQQPSSEPGSVVIPNSMQARAQRDYFQAKLAEQQLKLRSRELLPAGDVEKVWAGEVTAVRSAVMSAYASAATRIYRAGVTDGEVGVERELKALGESILRDLANPERAMPALESTTPELELEPDADDDDGPQAQAAS